MPYLFAGNEMSSFAREMFSNPENQTVVRKLVENSLPLLPKSTAATLRGMCNIVVGVRETLLFWLSAEAAKTYYNSAAGTERLKSSGKYTAKCLQQRRRNRLKRVQKISLHLSVVLCAWV